MSICRGEHPYFAERHRKRRPNNAAVFPRRGESPRRPAPDAGPTRPIAASRQRVPAGEPEPRKDWSPLPRLRPATPGPDRGWPAQSGVIAPNCQRTNTRLRFRKPTQRKQGGAVVVMIDGHAGPHSNGAADEFEGILMPCLLLTHCTQEMKHPGSCGCAPGFADTPARPFDPAVPMELDCCVERTIVVPQPGPTCTCDQSASRKIKRSALDTCRTGACEPKFRWLSWLLR